MINESSTIGELLNNPIGRDTVGRLLFYSGKDISLVDNPLMRGLKLSSISKLSPELLTPGLLHTLIALFNQCESESPAQKDDSRAWWKEAVVYQIYPRSFCDSDGDGIGDLPGIISKLDYLKDLGVNAIWLSPIYDSPNDDNGYDIRDYRAIMAEFGSMEDMERLIAECHHRGMRIIVDMVLNHTSDEHEWFRSSLADPKGRYGDYYIWKNGIPEVYPNNWTSMFSGPAWRYFPERGQWALHLFSKKQIDLNWENPQMREDVYDMMGFWVDKGIDGFRLDVINFISKTSFEDGDDAVSDMLGYRGCEHYFFGKRLHHYLREMNERVFAGHDLFVVGETPGTGPEMNKLISAKSRNELSMVFSFDHLDNPGRVRFEQYDYDMKYLKQLFAQYQGDYSDYAWPSIFFENHDNPRMLSKADRTLSCPDKAAKMLAVMALTSRGTPFIYQGQELGCANVEFSDISELRDVESINKYNELIEEGYSPAEAFATVNAGSRDHARVPMCWNASEQGGFTSGTPWIRMGINCVPASVQQGDRDSVLSFYKRMTVLRHTHDTLVYGKFTPKKTADELFCYERTGKETLYVEMNMSGRTLPRPYKTAAMKLLISNYRETSDRLRPFEANVYRK